MTRPEPPGRGCARSSRARPVPPCPPGTLIQALSHRRVSFPWRPPMGQCPPRGWPCPLPAPGTGRGRGMQEKVNHLPNLLPAPGTGFTRIWVFLGLKEPGQSDKTTGATPCEAPPPSVSPPDPRVPPRPILGSPGRAGLGWGEPQSSSWGPGETEAGDGGSQGGRGSSLGTGAAMEGNHLGGKGVAAPPRDGTLGKLRQRRRGDRPQPPQCQRRGGNRARGWGGGSV